MFGFLGSSHKLFWADAAKSNVGIVAAFGNTKEAMEWAMSNPDATLIVHMSTAERERLEVVSELHLVRDQVLSMEDGAMSDGVLKSLKEPTFTHNVVIEIGTSLIQTLKKITADSKKQP